MYDVGMRLNKFLAGCGVASRRACDELIKKGEIIVNGKVCTDLSYQVNVKKDKVFYNGLEVKLEEKLYYIKFHKPKNVICSAKDEKGRKTVFDYVKIEGVRLFNVGRLDYETEGLLIMTNDGEFAQKLIHPSFEIPKIYQAVIEGEVTESQLAVMRAGVVANKERMPSCKIKKISFSNNETRLEITINEGINRQIRKMFEAVGKTVKFLKRCEIGPIKLGGIPRGDYRDFNDEDLAFLAKFMKK